MSPRSRPCVSLLIPCFEAQAFVSDAIQCALRQTYGHVEIIVAPDDGSSYRHLRDTFQSPQLRIIAPGDRSGSGAAAARNRALDEASGDYFAVLDADDFIPDDYLEKMMDVAMEEGAAVANSHYTRANPQDVVRVPPIHHRSLSLSGFGQLLASIHTVVHRSLETGFVDGFAEDVVRDGLLIAKRGTVAIVDTHYVLRLRSGSTCDASAAQEEAIQHAYRGRIAQILHHPTTLGVQGLSWTDRQVFADLFRFRAAVSRLFSEANTGQDYNTFVAGQEASLWDRFRVGLHRHDLTDIRLADTP